MNVLPMGKKTTTLLKSDHKKQPEEVKEMRVKSSTINFLKQFARAYSYEKKLGYELGGFVAN